MERDVVEYDSGGILEPGSLYVELPPGERIIDRWGYTIAVVGCTWPVGDHAETCDGETHARTVRPATEG